MSSRAQDEAAITRLLVLYRRALDRLDAPLLRSLSTDEARVTLGRFHDGGPDGFVAVAMGFVGSMTHTQHGLGNVLIEADGDEAASEAHVHAYHREEAEDAPPHDLTVQDLTVQDLTVGARYLSRYERRPQGWRIVRHEEVAGLGTKLGTKGAGGRLAGGLGRHAEGRPGRGGPLGGVCGPGGPTRREPARHEPTRRRAASLAPRHRARRALRLAP